MTQWDDACDSNDMFLFYKRSKMAQAQILVAVILLIIGTQVSAVEFMLKPHQPTCTVLISTFDPIKVEAVFPTIANKKEGEKFEITLTNDKTGKIEQTVEVEDGKTYRNNFMLESNILYSLCITFVTERFFGPNERIFVGFLAEEHFQSKIGKIEIPSELANEQNLKIIYETASKMKELNNNTIENQKKQRELEDKLVDLSLHKGKRIVTITLIECFVIVVSGVYQILALRRFLIEKNLY